MLKTFLNTVLSAMYDIDKIVKAFTKQTKVVLDLDTIFDQGLPCEKFGRKIKRKDLRDIHSVISYMAFCIDACPADFQGCDLYIKLRDTYYPKLRKGHF